VNKFKSKVIAICKILVDSFEDNVTRIYTGVYDVA